jgi:hypothetical protein
VWTGDDDKDIEYGRWHRYTAKTTRAEQSKVHPPQGREEILPHWNDGVPTKFRLRVYCPSFFNNGVHHQPVMKLTSLELRWGNMYMLSRLKENDRLLPGDCTSEWSGVYRISCPNVTIDRCCGKDPTGTLYIGRACSRGSKGGNWSILRTRVRSILNREHHVMSNWSSSDLLRQKFPWESLAVEWAFTDRERPNYKGDPVPEAIMAESWLLSSYNDSFGELPPWNQRG